jgi:hypothetical protein
MATLLPPLIRGQRLDCLFAGLDCSIVVNVEKVGLAVMCALGVLAVGILKPPLLFGVDHLS